MPIRNEQARNPNAVIVEIGTLGGEMRKFTLTEGTTVSQLLVQAGYPSNCEVRCNGEPYGDGDVLVNGDVLIAMPEEKVAGA